MSVYFHLRETTDTNLVNRSLGRETYHVSYGVRDTKVPEDLYYMKFSDCITTGTYQTNYFRSVEGWEQRSFPCFTPFIARSNHEIT